MSNIHQKRAFVASLYQSPNWKKRVERMADEQVVAIYLRAKSEAQKPEPKKESEPDDLTLF